MKFSLVHWLIAAALLANGAVYYWQQTQPETVARVDSSGLRELKLLSEVEEDELSVAASQFALPVEAPVPEQQPAPELLPEETEPEESPAETAEPATETEAAEPDEIAVAAVPAETAEPEPVAAPQPEPPAPPPRCWLAGPVGNEALSEQLTVAFAAAGISMDLVLQTTEVAPDNWVYLPTSGEQADVRRLSRELRQGGIDNFPITDGPLAGSLSLGLFRSEERAIAVRDNLRSRGYQQVDIYQRPAFAEQPWISLDDVGRVALDWPAEEGTLPGYDALRLLAVECDPGS